MRRTLAAHGFVFALTLLLQPAYSQIRTGDWAISPWVQNMVVGESSRLQILDEQWQELSGAQWSVSDESIAHVYPDEQHKNVVVIESMAPGEVTVAASLNGVTHSLTINIWADHLPADHRATWNSLSFGKAINEVKARRVSQEDPWLYMATKAGEVAVVHAVERDGIQLWRWIVPESAGNAAKLLAGDDEGGVTVRLQREHDYAVYSLSSRGNLQWTYSGNDKLQSHALGFDTLYLVEAASGHLHARLVAVDSARGQEKFKFRVPDSIVKWSDLAPQTHSCVPSLHAQTPEAALFSRLLVNTDGNAYLAFTVAVLNLQALDCTSETAFHTVNVRRRYDNSLFLWKISPNGALVTSLLQHDQGEEPPSQDLSPVILPTGDLIPDGEGGVLLAVRQFPGGSSNTPIVRNDYVYRITEDGKVAYKLALPPFAGLRVDEGMVLNEDNHAFTTVGGLVICFDSISGRELWRYDTQTIKATIIFAAEDGGLVIENANRHMLALDKNGKKTADEDFNPASQVNSKLPDYFAPEK